MHKQKSPFCWYSAQNLYDMYVSLCRYHFVAKVTNNGHMEVRNTFGPEITDVMCLRKT